MKVYPLGPLQEALLLHVLSTGNQASALQQHIVSFSGNHDSSGLLKACRLVVEKQPNLRGKLKSGTEGYVVEILDTSLVEIEKLDLLGPDNSKREVLLEKFLQKDLDRAFPDELPLCRFTLLQFDASSACLVWTISSILVDRASIGIILHQILTHWMEKTPITTDRKSAWETIAGWNKNNAGLTDDKSKEYWQTYLDGVEPSNWLPKNVYNDGNSGGLAKYSQLALSERTTRKLKDLTQEHMLSWETVAETTWALLAQKFSGEKDLLFSVERRLRNEEHQSLAGVLSNIILRRLSPPSNFSIIDWLCSEQKKEPELIKHSICTLPKVIQWAGLGRDSSWLTSLVCVENPATSNFLKPVKEDLELELESRHEIPGIPVVATMSVGDQIHLSITSDDTKVDSSMVQQLLTYWKKLFEELADKPTASILDLSILSDEEKQTVLNSWNKTNVPFSTNKCVHHLFSEQVAKTPDWTAISMGSESLSYQELDKLSDKVAGLLSTQGVRKDSRVAICLPRSLELPVSMMGVMKAGGGYVPIDPAYPKERISLILDDSDADIVIAKKETENLINDGDTPVLLIESVHDLTKAPSSFVPLDKAIPSQLAYVIYTSGSTGRPKGVAMPHNTMVNLIEWQLRESAGLPQQAKTLQFSALSFDVSFQEMLATLCSGGQLVLITEEIRHNPSALWQCITENSINRIFLPFVALQQLAESAKDQDKLPDSLLEVITAGEQLQITPQLVEMFIRIPHAKLDNQYGPSETHVATYLTLTGDASNWPLLPTIGRPIANTKVYILDEFMTPVPVGGIGEIYIGGVALAREYLNRPEMTSERFLPNPYYDGLHERIYRTGDLGRFLPDGCIEFLGRADDQVKIRGFRVELAEIETVLRRDATIADCIVKTWTHQGEKRLVAYVVTSSGEVFDEGRVRDKMHSMIPDYMCPSFYVQIEQLPKTPSGKVNRRALPEPVLEEVSFQAKFEHAQNNTEEEIIHIWQEVLNISNIGRKDRFFELGGTSLLMIRVHRKLEMAMSQTLPITTLFKHPTVEALAAHIVKPEEATKADHKQVTKRAELQRKAMLRQSALRSNPR